MQPTQLGKHDPETKPPQLTTAPARKEQGAQQRNKILSANKNINLKHALQARKAGAEFKAQCGRRMEMRAV